MSDMPTESPAHAKPGDWTAGQKWYAAFLVACGVAISAIAFKVIYATVTAVARPYMHGAAWTVVVSGEIAFVFLFGVGILLAWRRAPSGALRGLFMALLIAGSIVLNIWSARGVIPDMASHLVVVCAFFAVLLTGKAAFTLLRGGKVRADRISLGEWLAHPVHSFRLQRWMTTWGESSRAVAHARYMRLLFTIAIAQADPAVGKRLFRWRRNLPVTLRYQLSTGLLPQLDGKDWQEAVTAHVQGQLHPPRTAAPEAPSWPSPATLPEGTPAAITAPPGVTPAKVSPRAVPVSAVRRVRKLGRRATDDDLLDAMREMAAEGRPPTKTRVRDELPVGDERAARLVAAYQREQPVPITRAAAAR